MARRFFDEAGVPLQEEEVEEKVKRQRAKIYEGSEKTPVLMLQPSVVGLGI